MMHKDDRAPTRVLHVFGAMNCGGAETLIMNVYRQVDRDRIQFDFAVDTEQRCYYDDEIERLGGRIFHLPHPGSVGLRAYRRTLLHVLHEQGPFAAVHSHVHHFSGIVLHAADRAEAPVRLAHSHTTSDGQASQPGRSAYRWLMRRLIRRHATGLIGCSRAACEALFGPACWRDPRVAALPNAIDLDRYRRLDESRCALREQLGLPADATLIAHVGSFSPVKNHRLLIETFAALMKQLPAAHLMLAGDGPLRPAIEAHIRACGVEPFVYLRGVRDDVPRLLAASDLFLFPSLYEGLGIAVIEAQAAGIPCVVADTVPAEADMRLGLMRFVSVQAEPDRWVDQALAALDTRRPVWIERQRALQTAGYDIRVITRRLEQLYVGRQTQYEGPYDHHNSVASHD